MIIISFGIDLLASFVLHHSLELVKFLAHLVANFRDIAPWVRHLVQFVEVAHADARELRMHFVSVIRIVDLVAIDATGSLYVWRRPAQLSWHLGSIRHLTRVISNCRLRDIGHCDHVSAAVRLSRIVNIALFGQRSWVVNSRLFHARSITPNRLLKG